MIITGKILRDKKSTLLLALFVEVEAIVDPSCVFSGEIVAAGAVLVADAAEVNGISEEDVSSSSFIVVPSIQVSDNNRHIYIDAKLK